LREETHIHHQEYHHPRQRAFLHRIDTTHNPASSIMSQANTPVPVPDSPVLERPAASQTATTAPPPVNVTPPQASSAAPQTDTTAPRSSAATTPVVFPDGTLTAPNPSQSLTPTPVPQVSVIPASSNGTASIPHQEHWRVELCDADDMETCVRSINPVPVYSTTLPC
jgi:hypothetical protein